MFSKLDGSRRQVERKAASEQHYQHALSPLTWWAACSFAAILGFSRLSYGLLLPAMRADLQGSYSTFGLIGTVNFVGYLLGMLGMPFLLLRIKNRALLNMLALLAMGIAMVASALSGDLWQLGIWRLLVGIFSAFTTILTISLTLENTLPQERGQASGIVWMGGAIGILISGLIAPLVIQLGVASSWRLVWIIMGGIGVIAAVGFSNTLSKIPPPAVDPVSQQEIVVSSSSERSLWANIRPLFQFRRLLFLTLAYTLFGCGYIIYFTFFISLIAQQGVSTLYTGIVWAAIGVAGALSGWFWGRAVDRSPTGYPLALALLLGAIGAFSVVTHMLLIEYAGAALIGLTAFIGPPLIVTTLLKLAVDDEHYAVNYSVLTVLFAIGQIIGPLVGGVVIAQFGLVMGVATSAIVLGIGAVCAWIYGVIHSHQ